MPTDRFKSVVLGSGLTGTDNGDNTITLEAAGGTETLPASIVDAKGDLIAATAADTPARLPAGTDGQILESRASEATGLKWVAAPGGGILATLIDAKGDLIAGSAADTAARLAVGSNGQVLTADSAETTGIKWATPSAGGGGATEVAYAQITAYTSFGGAGADLITAPAFTADGTSVYVVEFFTMDARAPANGTTYINLKEGATFIGQLAEITHNTTTGQDRRPVFAARRLIPTAGSHTYKINGEAAGGTGDIYAGAGGAGVPLPAYIRVTKW